MEEPAAPFDDPTAHAAAEAPPRRRPSPRRLMLLTLGLVVGAWGSVWMVDAIEAAREAARRSQCVCNLCQITLALHNYHEAFGCFPPARVVDRAGTPLYSWRVAILPYMEQRPLYEQFRLDEPWDSPANRPLLAKMPGSYLCPTRAARWGADTTLTCYAAITGPGTVFPDDRCLRLDEITDGTSQTLMVAEVATLDIPWTAPVDLDIRTMSRRINDVRRPGISSPHPGGANVAFADASYRFLKNTVPASTLDALLTVDGGEDVNMATLSRP